MPMRYQKHKCDRFCSMSALICLILIDILAFFHITDDVVFFAVSTQTELFIFTVSLTLTYYYIYKQHYNVRAYIKLFTRLFKGVKNESK